MEFAIKHNDKSVSDVMRLLGYQAAHFQKEGEFSIVRRLARTDYPRFHLYGTQSNSSIVFKLHLDQKKPSYEGQTGHSGDYDGEVVQAEAKRIQQILNPESDFQKTP